MSLSRRRFLAASAAVPLSAMLNGEGQSEGVKGVSFIVERTTSNGMREVTKIGTDQSVSDLFNAINQAIEGTEKGENFMVTLFGSRS